MMNKKQKKALAQIISAVVLLAVISLVTGKVSVSPYVEFVLYVVPYLLVGYDILKKALKGIKNKQVFDENFLMAVATLGLIALGVYKKGVAGKLVYQIGGAVQQPAVGRNRKKISKAMEFQPD